MAGQAPFFLTGASAKIKLNNITLAFCTDISYTIDVVHKKPRVLGMYEPVSIEPMSYNVSGSFSVVRYVGGVDGILKQFGQQSAPSVSDKGGNGIGRWSNIKQGDTPGFIQSLDPTTSEGSKLTKIKQGDTPGFIQSLDPTTSEGRPDESFNPAALFVGRFFDIEIWQKVQVPNGKITTTTGQTAGQHELYPAAKLRKCRIVRSRFTLNKRGVAMQVFDFEATYADEDSFIAKTSGVGQHLDSF